MKRLRFTILIGFIAIVNPAHSQTQPKYSLKERQNKYPFNATAKVAIVSFWIKSHAELHSEMSIPFKPNSTTIDVTKFEQTQFLTKPQIDTLTDILYNSYYQATNTRLSNMRCYEPRNAIVFYDKSGKVFAYIEVCFECSKIKPGNPKIILDLLCDETYTKLHTFFVSHSIITNEYEL